MIINRYYFAFILHLIILSGLNSQKVTVSREINIKNNYAYDILPNIGDHIIFYHDRGIENTFEIYDKNLRYVNTITPEFEKRNIQPTGVLPMDSVFHFYYSYREEGDVYFKIRVYDKNVYLKDTVTYAVKDKRNINSNPRFAYSKNKSKVVVFTPDEKFLNIQLIDNHSLKLIYNFNLIVQGVNLKTDFEKLLVTDEGEINIICRKSSFWDRTDADGFNLIRIVNTENISLHRFTPESDEISDLLMDYDEKNKRLLFAGFTSTGNDADCNGYFGFSILPQDIPDEAEILINKFSSEFIAEATGKKPGKIKVLSDYRLQEILPRNDGGVIIVSELVKEFTRRSQMNVPGQFSDQFASRGFIDYYHEDIIMLSTFPDGKEHWKKILFKKTIFTG